MRLLAVAFCSVLILCGSACYASTLYVDRSNPNCPGSGTLADPFCQIQVAISAARDGDVIVVGPGVYLENLDFLGKAIVVRSTHGAAQTFVNGGQSGSVVKFVTGEGPATRLEGFALTNGSGTFDGSRYFRGGGVYCRGSSPTLRSNVIAYNSAVAPSSPYLADGGGIWAGYQSSPEISNSVIAHNVTDGSGGGIACIFSSSPRILSNTITANQAGGTGAGIDCKRYSSPEITQNLISLNRTPSVGGGIRAYKGSPMVRDNVITGNEALAGAAGIGCIFYSSPTIENNTISHNKAAMGVGGGISSSYYCGTIIRNNSITHNESVSGGGIWCYSRIMAPTIYGNDIRYNRSRNGGGGMTLIAYPYTPANASNNTVIGNFTYNAGGGAYALGWEITGSLFANNSGMYGGAMYLLGGSHPPPVTNCTLSGNTASLGAGILAGRSSRPSITNTILWGNSPDEIGFAPGASAAVSYSDVQGGYPGTGNINADPIFVDPAALDYRIACTSPCAEAGTNSVGAILPQFDLSGSDLRILGTIDMGADEAGLHWALQGTPRVGGAPVSFLASASNGQNGTLAVLLVSTGSGDSDGIRLPLGGGRTVQLDPSGLLSQWLLLPPSLWQAPLAGCSGASTQPFGIPQNVPVGVQVFYAGFSVGTGAKVLSVSTTRSFTSQ